MLALLVFGCHQQRHTPFVVEDSTPIVGAGRATTEALGIETQGGVFTPLISQGTAVPWAHSDVFSTAQDGQTDFAVGPFRGSNQMVASNHSLGRFRIVGIPPAPRGIPQIEITFTITERQILLSARDLKSKSDLQIERVNMSR